MFDCPGREGGEGAECVARDQFVSETNQPGTSVMHFKSSSSPPIIRLASSFPIIDICVSEVRSIIKSYLRDGDNYN